MAMEIFLSSFVQVLFEKLLSPDLWSFARRERIYTLLMKWSRMWEEIGAVLADAEEKQMTDRWGVKLWLEDLEDLAYNLDDVLDEFASEALRQKVMEKPLARTSKVRAFVPCCYTSFNPSTLMSDIRMRSQIDDITTRLDDIFNRRARLGLHIVDARPCVNKAPQRPPSSSLVHVPCLYGRNGDKTKVLELLLSEQSSNDKVRVVPIVGMGGVGKTTLAQDVYNDEMVGKYFEMKAWVCVSENFDIVGVTKAILESITSQTCHFNVLDQVQVQLKKVLKGKKFLIVLDDVWNKNHGDWINLKSPFSDGAPGSKVMVTTRNRDVAMMMAGIDKFHCLKQLSEDDCWSVFAQYAFENRSIDESPNLVSIGRKIVQKCGGLPLAARTLGGLLRCKLRDNEWEEVLNSKMWELSNEENDILPALRLSYYHLPSHLRKCFGYCSVLPKDYEFEEKELVFLWMAEGLIQKPMGKRQIEDVGCEYFHELSSRSFFQPSSSGQASMFVMHDLITDLAQFVARRTCFRVEEKLGDNDREKTITKARHLSYTRGYRDGIQKFEAFQKAKNLRSFLPFGSKYQVDSYLTHDVPLRLLPKLRRLRVLSLRGYKIDELSSSIGDLKHVRFLDFSCALIATLPESISTLYNLQTLILRDCKNLSKLPFYTSNLINLRHLDVTGANSLQEMPPEIGRLTNLQTLSNFIVGKGVGTMINQLGNLIHLRGTLCISGLETLIDALDAKGAKLKDKQGLDELSLNWSCNSDNCSNGTADSEILDMLEPHKKLKVLTFCGYPGLKFPTWVGNSLFSNMVSLKFQNCDKCTSFAPLGQLPSLGTLHIAGMQALESVGLEFYGSGCSNPFPTLWRLTFEDMPKWIYWSTNEVKEETQAFSRLQQLSIKRCPKLLGELPSDLPCLRNLAIEECPQLVIAWIPSPAELIEVRNTLHFGSLISLSLKNVLLPVSYGDPQEGDEAEQEHAIYRHLSSLTSLSFENIQGLTCLPNWFFQGLTALQELSISGCKELRSLWSREVKIHHRLFALRSMVVKRCPLLISLFREEEAEEEGLQQEKQNKELPYLMMLEYLKIEDCKKLEKLSLGLHNLKSLRELIINNCPSLSSFPKTGLPSTLRTLRIDKCVTLRSLPGLMKLNCLEKLQVWKCPSLTYLSCSKAGLPPSLKQLDIWHCENLESLIAEVGMKINCPSLESVEIWQCRSLKSLPGVMHNDYNGGSLRSLSKLWISGCDNVESIPEEWFTTANLRELYIKWCRRLKSLPHHAYTNNNNITSLQISIVSMGSKSLSVGGLHRLSSLKRLFLEDYGGASFPPEKEDDRRMLWLPPSLIQLYIRDFPNMEKLSCEDLQNIPSLEELRVLRCPKLTIIAELGQLPLLSELWIKGCPNLATFSAERQGGLLLPPSLLYLRIDECQILKQKCERKKGHYWPLISNIPHVEIVDNPQSWDVETELCFTVR